MLTHAQRKQFMSKAFTYTLNKPIVLVYGISAVVSVIFILYLFKLLLLIGVAGFVGAILYDFYKSCQPPAVTLLPPVVERRLRRTQDINIVAINHF